MKCQFGKQIILWIILFGLKDNKYINYDKIKIEELIQNDNYVGGQLLTNYTEP